MLFDWPVTYGSGMTNRFLPAASGVILMFLLAACEKPASTPDGGSSPTTNTVAAPAKPKPEFVKLLGRWERPDGGYVLELRSVDAEGMIHAAYFNPGSIHVERAMAFMEQGTVKVFVLLRDANYPGCTYKLTYDVKADQLYGQYYQATMQETYDVAFGRLKEDGPEPVK